MPDLHNSKLSSNAETENLHRPEVMSRMGGIKSLRAQLPAFCWSVLGLAAVTWVALRLGLNIPTVGFLYLIMVLFAAAGGGFWSGTLTSIVAAVCLDFFFVPPIFHF